MAVSVDLSKPALLHKILDTPFAIQKPTQTHLLIAHSLHNRAHLVIGDFGLSPFGNLIVFGNEKDHLFDQKHPFMPVVINMDIVPGVSKDTLLFDLFQKTPFGSTCALILFVSGWLKKIQRRDSFSW
jgi:hypothetical protein